ncbi:MAG: hypothetical protein VXZ36_15515 [Pseudomonadota bacterium]|nr:hypothetical protein [Pseudomonadota bacterium]
MMKKITFSLAILIGSLCSMGALEASPEPLSNRYIDDYFDAQRSSFFTFDEEHLPYVPLPSPVRPILPNPGIPVIPVPPKNSATASSATQVKRSSAAHTDVKWPEENLGVWTLMMNRFDNNESQLLLMHVNATQEVQLSMADTKLAFGSFTTPENEDFRVKAVSLCDCGDNGGAIKNIEIEFHLNGDKELSGDFTVKEKLVGGHVVSMYSGNVEGQQLAL